MPRHQQLGGPELIQLLLLSRRQSLNDIAWNSAGAVVGFILGLTAGAQKKS